MHRAHLSALFLALFFALHAIQASSIISGGENSRTSNATRPNVVLILADDLGWTDLACYGSDLHETPSLDHLAATGMRFTQNYSACTVCSPTRAALMTGKYPARLHITDWIPGAMPDNPKLLVPDWTKHLPMEEHTMAEAFQAAGYKTASIGKWHLGSTDFYPEKHGFDLNIAGTDKPQPPSYFAPWKIPTLREGAAGEYLTDRLADEAVAFVEASKDQPFFLYLPHFAVHTPIQIRKEIAKKYEAKIKPNFKHKNANYASMLESLDSAIGKVMDTLKRNGLEDRTIVVFTSDNGGLITRATTDNSPLRYGKASAYEGGVRVPLIVRWPGHTRPGSISDLPVITMDLYRTLIEAAELKVPDTRTSNGKAGEDGVSLVPTLRGESHSIVRDLYWHYPHHQHYQLGGATPYSAIRSGDFKLIEFHNDQTRELYDLRDDIDESNDLSQRFPEVVQTLLGKLQSWRSNVDAQMPTPNPDYDPNRPEYTPPKR